MDIERDIQTIQNRNLDDLKPFYNTFKNEIIKLDTHNNIISSVKRFREGQLTTNEDRLKSLDNDLNTTRRQVELSENSSMKKTDWINILRYFFLYLCVLFLVMFGLKQHVYYKWIVGAITIIAVSVIGVELYSFTKRDPNRWSILRFNPKIGKLKKGPPKRRIRRPVRVNSNTGSSGGDGVIGNSGLGNWFGFGNNNDSGDINYNGSGSGSGSGSGNLDIYSDNLDLEYEDEDEDEGEGLAWEFGDDDQNEEENEDDVDNLLQINAKLDGTKCIADAETDKQNVDINEKQRLLSEIVRLKNAENQISTSDKNLFERRTELEKRRKELQNKIENIQKNVNTPK